jgi:outer membrane usher protein
MGQLMLRLHCKLGNAGRLLFGLALGLADVSGPGRLQAAAAQQNLQLEVYLNGIPTHMISSFVRLPDGKIGARRSELEELGLRIGLRRLATEVILLDEIPTLTYEYEERSQKILITVGDADREARVFDLRRKAGPRAEAGWGAVLNYDLFATTGSLQARQAWQSAGTSLTLDARAFSPYGTLEQSAIVASNQGQYAQTVRLDSSYRYSDQERMISWGIGDAINGGLSWTRPIRIGGVQAQSNFALRPDLVTIPLPTLGGTAAVPSTVDVYVNNLRTFSQNVGTGPFSVSNIPLVTGAGNAQLVVRDSSGQETRTTLPFYASASLLAPGLSTWSLDAGFPRLSYGSTNDAYVGSPVASGTLRRGIFDWLTVEGHAEGGSGLANGGVGAAVKTGTIGVAAAAVSASTLSGSGGLEAYASYETRLFGLNINGSSQRTFGRYDDLASATARLQSLTPQLISNQYGFLSYVPYISAVQNMSIYNDFRPPKAIDRFSVGALIPFDRKATWNLSYVHLIDDVNNHSNILSASYARSLPYEASLFATVFRDFGNSNNTGVFVGLSMPFGVSSSLTSGVSSGQGGTTASVGAVRSLGPSPGDYGWEVRDSEGVTPSRLASFSYRSSYLTSKVGVSENQSSSNAGLELRGSISTMGGGVFFSNWIDDAFAVVDAGAPNVGVSYENRQVGITNARGLLLVPTLRSYQSNKITIDPTSLPADAEIETMHDVVAPADRAGVLVKFKVDTDSTAALVVFTRPEGGFVPAGSAGRIHGGGDFVVGYDGQAFIKDLRSSNLATIELFAGTCSASFNFEPRPGEQVRVGPVTCR